MLPKIQAVYKLYKRAKIPNTGCNKRKGESLKQGLIISKQMQKQ